jgi:hypothetical protein
MLCPCLHRKTKKTSVKYSACDYEFEVPVNVLISTGEPLLSLIMESAMKLHKFVIGLIAAIALATPAYASQKVSGYYRVQGISEQQEIGSDLPSDRLIDQRLRLRYENILNEHVYLVYHAEIDTPWGEQSKGGIGAGGKANADGVNVETKHAFVDVTIPDTRYNMRAGIQAFGGKFDGVVIDNDMAGIRLHAAFDRLNLTANYFKLDAGERSVRDDIDLFVLQLATNPSKALRLDFDVYWLEDNNDTDPLKTERTEYFIGAKAGYTKEKLGLTGWVVYNTGKTESALPGVGDVNIRSYAASGKGTYAIPKGNIGLRVMYFPADDSPEDDKSFNGNITGGDFEFAEENLQIFLTDGFYNNSAAGRRALEDAAYAGYGLFGAVLSGDHQMAPMYVRWGLGYFRALDDRRDGSVAPADNRRGTQLGAEAAAQIGTIVAQKVDISLRGAYAVLGDFYDGQAGGADPDNLYKIAAMISIPF